MDYVEKIKKWLEHHPFSIFLSGGKDSVATLLWVLDNVRNKHFNIIYVEITGNTHKLCNWYVHYVAMTLGLEDKLLHLRNEKYDFFDCLIKWGIPLVQRYRWCEHHFKYCVYKDKMFRLAVVGLRQNESRRRMRLVRQPITLSQRNPIPGSYIITPIWDWDLGQVIDYIKEHGLRLNPCYAKYGHGGNCMFCPYRTDAEIIKTMHDPEWGPKIQRALTALLERQKGPIGKQIIERWLKLATQTVLHV